MKIKTPTKCIYCGATETLLSDEHIIPYSLGGTWIIPNASCAVCSYITSRFERSISRRTYLALRTKAAFPTYRPKKRPKSFDAVMVAANGTRRVISVPTSKYPTIFPILHLPPPGILLNAPLSDTSPEMKLSISGNSSEINAFLAEYPGAELSFEIFWDDLCRALAKIAHSFTIGHYGDVGYTPLLPQLILGGYPYLSHLVGCDVDVENSLSKSADGVSILIDPDGHIIVNIDIMGGRLPTYSVVSGLVTDWNVFMTNVAHVNHEDKPEYAHNMRTRFAFTHEWASAVVDSVRALVKRDFASLELYCPLLAGFSFEVYAIPPSHYLFVMKDDPGNIVSGPDGATLLQYDDHPEFPPRVEDLDLWYRWVNSIFGKMTEVWPFFLPVHDCGQSYGVDGDYALFSPLEKEFWEAQWNFILNSILRRANENAMHVDTSSGAETGSESVKE